MSDDPIAAARALIAAQPDLLFRCDLCPDECNCHPHHDMSMSGEYILCDGCEDFYNPKGVPDPLTLIATLADSLEAEQAESQRLREALTGLLRRDEINTCQHDETYRGGYLWEICHSCGTKWADDEGGRPEWRDPPEWILARAALRSTEASHDD